MESLVRWTDRTEVDWRTIYHRSKHAAARTKAYIFTQLIPYIGNKRKLLDLIQIALQHTESPESATFLDMFAGSGVVSRLAKSLGYRVISNDWEPYTRAINTCYIQCNCAPPFLALGGYESVIRKLNSLAPRVDWITEHLCPQDDVHYDVTLDRMFYMRKNGSRIDAIRHQIQEWEQAGAIDESEECCLIAPLLYQACYTSNTSGVFKGFHNGWGGRTRTALYRIAGDLELAPAVFFDNSKENPVFCKDAQVLAEELGDEEISIVYLDPPYNQHPYASNYHVLNTVALWDKPALPKHITRGTKSAIRTGWRTERRSAYNHKQLASAAYGKLLGTLNARYILTSYSTDGMIPLRTILQANGERGRVRLEMRGYKRYRVSSQRFSLKPMNVEFVIVLDTHKKSDVSVEQMMTAIESAEENVMRNHREYDKSKQQQLTLFEEAEEYGEEG